MIVPNRLLQAAYMQMPPARRNASSQRPADFITPEKLFYQTFNASPVAMSISCCKSGRSIDVNDAFVQLLGYSREECICHNGEGDRTSIFQNPADFEAIFAAARQGEAVRNREIRLRAKDGAERVVIISAEPIDVAGERRLLLHKHDITERVSLEEQLRQARKLESVGQLAAGIAHDFNNLLTIIQGSAGLALLEKGVPPRVTPLLRDVLDASERAASLTRQLLTFSSPQRMQLEALNIDELVQNIFQMLRLALGSSIELIIDLGANAVIMVCKGLIEQVLVNIAVNARDAMPHGGRLRIETRVVSVSRQSTARSEDGKTGRFARIAACDSGCGISQEHLARIFEPFFTTKGERGTGLGLATANGIIKQHGGWMEAVSDGATGTTMSIFLPVSESGEEVQSGSRSSAREAPWPSRQ